MGKRGPGKALIWIQNCLNLDKRKEKKNKVKKCRETMTEQREKEIFEKEKEKLRERDSQRERESDTCPEYIGCTNCVFNRDVRKERMEEEK